MGVVIEEEDFDTYDMLKELELARTNLYDKQQGNKQNIQYDITKISNKETNKVTCGKKEKKFRWS